MPCLSQIHALWHNFLSNTLRSPRGGGGGGGGGGSGMGGGGGGS